MNILAQCQFLVSIRFDCFKYLFFIVFHSLKLAIFGGCWKMELTFCYALDIFKSWFLILILILLQFAHLALLKYFDKNIKYNFNKFSFAGCSSSSSHLIPLLLSHLRLLHPLCDNGKPTCLFAYL